jgi:tRNA U34 5-methylaminomethyl-2-thiouridine-forming methyltransferase MnmC
MDHLSFVMTSDGSKTIFNEQVGENYHSRHGALQESEHVFLNSGLKYYLERNAEKKASILEVGFGTGLNAFLTFQEMGKMPSASLHYLGFETHPVPQEIWQQLNYATSASEKEAYCNLMEVPYGEKTRVASFFQLEKNQEPIQHLALENQIDLVYFDAFGPRAQAEMWDKTIFEKLFKALKVGGVLVTYCAMGQFKRDLKSIGFIVEAIPGPPGKREMTRATKA